jgi:hypothetical protein
MCTYRIDKGTVALLVFDKEYKLSTSTDRVDCNKVQRSIAPKLIQIALQEREEPFWKISLFWRSVA